MKPRLLDLFCGAGGATKGYQRAGFYVVGVDNKPQPHYCGDEFYQADALTYPLKGFDAYHASPPCQKYTQMQYRYKNKLNHPDLIAPIRERLLETGKRPYIIENVYNAPLKGHLMLCGTMFRLEVSNHRFFECPWMPLVLFAPCDHRGVYSRWDWRSGNRGERLKLLKALQVDWYMTLLEVREAVPPAYTEYIGKYLMEAMK